jgi:hypothetical protein
MFLSMIETNYQEMDELQMSDDESEVNGDTKIDYGEDINLPEKKRHPLNTGGPLFPIHTWLYFLYIVLAILLPIFGTLLIICGNWTNTGYFSLLAILNYPWPKVQVEDPNAHATALELLQVIPSSPAQQSLPHPAHLLDLRLLLLAVRPLPGLRHHRLPQAAVGEAAVGPGGVGRGAPGRRLRPRGRQGAGRGLDRAVHEDEPEAAGRDKEVRDVSGEVRPIVPLTTQ